MLNIKRTPLWVKGGFVSLSIFLLMSFLINPLLDPVRASFWGHIIAEVVNAPLLILSIPLLILYSYIGFGLEIVFNTGIGYESLGMFPAGVLFMKVFSAVYFFLLGALIVKVYESIKKEN